MLFPRPALHRQRRTVCFFLLVMLVAPAGALAQKIDKGHRILLERGLQIQALVFEDSPFDLKSLREANFTAVNWGWKSKMPALGPPPGFGWSRWMSGAKETALTTEEQPYTANLINLTCADEQNLNDPAVREAAAQWFESMRPKFPNTILYTNQYGGQVTNENMGKYMSACKPDMLSFDVYPFLLDGPAGGSPTNFYGDTMRYRKLALGIGVPYAMWLQTFHGENKYRDPSESEMRLNQFAAWTFGYKLVCAFTYNAGSTNLFKGPGDQQPTAAYHQIKKINRESLNLGAALVRLKSTDVRIIVGERKEGDKVVPNPQPIDVQTWKFGANDPYIRAISAENLGPKNNKLKGDVLIGWFKPLAAGDSPDETYFMITNGLSDRDGSAEQCRQRITLNLHFKDSGITSLQRFNRTTGSVEEVELKPVPNDPGRFLLTLELPGGTGDLLKFNTGVLFMPADPLASTPSRY